MVANVTFWTDTKFPELSVQKVTLAIILNMNYCLIRNKKRHLLDIKLYVNISQKMVFNTMDLFQIKLYP